MSFYAVAFLGMAPFGSLIIGGIAHKIGAPYALTIGGICCLIAAFLYHRKLPELRQQIYPIYAQMGISPKQSGKR